MLSSRPAQASSEDVRDLVADNGATINIIDNYTDPDGWWSGECNGAVGSFPANYVTMQ